jgi:hypothetical protein
VADEFLVPSNLGFVPAPAVEPFGAAAPPTDDFTFDRVLTPCSGNKS